MTLVTKCPECGFESAEIRCPRCYALKITGCDGVCSACASSCATAEQTGSSCGSAEGPQEDAEPRDPVL